MNSGNFRIVAMLSLLISGAVSAQNHTVFLVRHAEKAAEPASDPGLTEIGIARAENLAVRLANAKLAAVYTSQYRRTQLTAMPLAAASGIPITVVPIDKASAADYPQQLLARICVLPADASAVVVGHSNTIPAIAEAWTAHSVRAIVDDEYNRILIIKLKECRAVESLDLRF